MTDRPIPLLVEQRQSADRACAQEIYAELEQRAQIATEVLLNSRQGDYAAYLAAFEVRQVLADAADRARRAIRKHFPA